MEETTLPTTHIKTELFMCQCVQVVTSKAQSNCKKIFGFSANSLKSTAAVLGYLNADFYFHRRFVRGRS